MEELLNGGIKSGELNVFTASGGRKSLFAYERTWMVSADTNILGYEYAKDEIQALANAIIKYGAPAKWGVDEYTIAKIEWAEEDDYV